VYQSYSKPKMGRFLRHSVEALAGGRTEHFITYL